MGILAEKQKLAGSLLSIKLFSLKLVTGQYEFINAFPCKIVRNEHGDLFSLLKLCKKQTNRNQSGQTDFLMFSLNMAKLI